MRKLLKILLIALLLLLIVSAVITDLPVGKSLFGHLDLGLYLKVISIIGMLIAFFLSMGYKHRIDASQKYRRAGKVLEEAEAKAKQQKQTLEQMEANLKEAYAKKEAGLNRQIKEAHTGYENRVKDLKQQNIELKETVAKLMRALKRERREG